MKKLESSKIQKSMNFASLLLSISFVCLFSIHSSAQHNKKAITEYEKAQKSIAKSDYVKAVELYLSTAKYELEDENPDHLFLGKMLDELAGWYSFPQYYHVSAQYYAYAARQYVNIGMLEEAKNSLYLAGILADSIIKYDEVVNPNDSEGEYVAMDFSVRSIQDVRGDTTFFVLDGGKNHSLSPNQLGWILTRYDDDVERGNNIFGNCGLIEVYNTYSTAWAVISEESKLADLSLFEYDNVELKVRVKDDVYRGILFELAKLNVYFTDDYEVPIYSFYSVRNLPKKASEEAVIHVMRKTIRETANTLYDPEDYDTVTYPKFTSGMFAGMNMWEAMLNCTNEDIRVYLRFVASFPAKYMGRNYRLDETFATWVINDNVLASEESVNQTKEFLALSTTDSMKYWLVVHKGLIRSGALNLDEVNTHIYALINDSNFTKAETMSNLMIDISNSLGFDSVMYIFQNTQGQNFSAQKRYDEAVQLFTEVLKRDSSNSSAKWFRGHAYLSNDEYKRAMSDFDNLRSEFPDWAGGHGMYGWASLKMGDFAQALVNCEAGYDRDSFNTTYIMNLGHAYLMMNQPKQARIKYMECFENMEYSTTFTEGVLADFEFFSKRFWQPDLVRKEKDFLTNEWESHYKFKVLAKEHFEKGKALENEEKYDEAGKSFDQAIAYEMSGDVVRFDWLWVYNRWAAYQYFMSEKYDESLTRYMKCWEVNRLHMKDLEEEISDLGSIGYLYGLKENYLLKDMYVKMQNAAQRKLRAQTRSNNLYVISIGLNTYGNAGYKFAEKDARLIAKTIGGKAKLVFDNSDIAVLDGANFTLANVQNAFENVIGKSRPGDCFVLYYTGYINKNSKGSFVFGDDTLTNEQLLGWLGMMQADKKVILMDAANPALISEYAKSNDGEQGYRANENLTFILSEGRIELPDDSGGLFTSFLISGIKGEAAVNWGSKFEMESAEGMTSLAYITAKGLEGYMYGKMNKDNMQFELKSYSKGADFPISFTSGNMLGGKDTIPPMIYISGSVSSEGSRGGKSNTVMTKGVVYGQALDASGIAEIQVNGNSVEFSQNGKFELSVASTKKWSKIVVRALDKMGLWSVDSFYLNKSNAELVSDKGPEEKSGKGVNYALIIATNEYDTWSDLKNPINDAREIGQILETAYGFKVEIVENKSRNEIRDVLDSYYRKSYSSKDQLLIFVAGHGVHLPFYGGQVVCKDSKLSTESRAIDSYISFNEIKHGLNTINSCPHIMLTLDVCFGGAGFKDQNALYYGNSVEEIKKDPEGYLAKTLTYKTRLYLTSGDSTYVTDGRGKHSPFADKFIETLNSHGKDKGKIVTLSDFANNMRFTEGGRQQIKYGSFGESHKDGDFVFLYVGDNLKYNSSKAATGMGLN